MDPKDSEGTVIPTEESISYLSYMFNSKYTKAHYLFFPDVGFFFFKPTSLDLPKALWIYLKNIVFIDNEHE